MFAGLDVAACAPINVSLPDGGGQSAPGTGGRTGSVTDGGPGAELGAGAGGTLAAGTGGAGTGGAGVGGAGTGVGGAGTGVGGAGTGVGGAGTGGSAVVGAGTGGVGVGGTGVGGAGTGGSGAGGLGSGGAAVAGVGGCGTGGIVAGGAGGSVDGGNDTPSMVDSGGNDAPSMVDSGGQDVGPTSDAGPICPMRAEIAGSWVEIPAAPDSTGFVASDAFAAGGDDIFFAGTAPGPEYEPQMRILHWSHGCWSTELTAPSNIYSQPSVLGLPSGETWAAGGADIYQRTGTTWTPIDAGWRANAPPASMPALTRVRAAGSDDLWATERSNVLHRHGGAWTGYNFSDPSYPAGAAIAFSYNDVWIDGPSSVWIASSSDQIGSTMDPAFLHHFDGTTWTRVQVAIYGVLAMWHAGPTFWLAAPGQMAASASLVRYDGATTASTVAILGDSSDFRSEVRRLWGRTASDVWAAGTNLVHFDGLTWSVVADAPPSAHVLTHDTTNTFITGDPRSVWIVTAGPRFFRRVEAVAP